MQEDYQRTRGLTPRHSFLAAGEGESMQHRTEDPADAAEDTLPGEGCGVACGVGETMWT